MIKVQKQIQNLEEKSDRDQKELESLYEKRRSLFNSYQEIKLRKANDKEKYSQILDTVLYSADIICCTLSSAGSDKLDRFRDYIEAVIVDEASQVYPI